MHCPGGWKLPLLKSLAQLSCPHRGPPRHARALQAESSPETHFGFHPSSYNALSIVLCPSSRGSSCQGLLGQARSSRADDRRRRRHALAVAGRQSSVELILTVLPPGKEASRTGDRSEDSLQENGQDMARVPGLGP